MELIGTIQQRGSLTGSFDFDQANYELLNNKPSINGVELIGNKTSSDLHINTGGGGGGTSDYNELENKPSINGVTIQGNKPSSDYGLQQAINFPGDPTKYMDGEGNFTTPQYGIIDYSTDETEIGKWIDGTPLYQKTFDLTNRTLTDLTWNNNILGTTNIKIRNFVGYFNLGTNAIFPYYYHRSTSEFFTAVTNDVATDINIRPNMNYNPVYAGIITIQYTKTS